MEVTLPYVGQTVLFMPRPDDEVARKNKTNPAENAEEYYIPAIITRVWSATVVNLKIFPDCGPVQDRTSVPHISQNFATYHFREISPRKAVFQVDQAMMVSFGNYLLSDERKERTSERHQQSVTGSDFDWWRHKHNLPQIQE